LLSIGCNCEKLKNASMISRHVPVHSLQDGKCAAAAATIGPNHQCGTLKRCDELWPSYNFNTDQTWCCDSWCYVNATTCNATAASHTKYKLTVAPSWLNVPGLYYSYDACQDDQSFPEAMSYTVAKNGSYAHYTAATCPFKAMATGCECTGDNTNLGADNIKNHGADYGKWCAAWEDGKITKGVFDPTLSQHASQCLTEIMN